ncbi:MAG: 1-(5-phosphoribosyl)-5-[(5-phosphoribosylamino)methylideneamino]imidazole-4-carboxamide isomerase [Chitinophagaceae bacterium]|nr:1-(5-phosphoribosyl)-5-[(5-phosphoribosylamino)methylideneamino]imidazole-4-carboxamide isomerase [Chitinophagaceae bacterium]
MTIIPAIDIIDGKCVRLTKGDYTQMKVYNENPLEVAQTFEGAGIKRLHLVDLDGAREGRVKNWKVLERIAGHTNLTTDFSGGISTTENLSITFNSGAAYATIGSMAVTDEQILSEWLLAFGPDRFIIAADVRDGKVATRGWTKTSGVTATELFERYKRKGVRQFFCTDISKDGLLTGPAFDLYRKLMNEHPSVDLIASGGIAETEHLRKLREDGCAGAIIGKAIYENKITLKELEQFA